MSLLRIFAPLGKLPVHCEWSLDSVPGAGPLAGLPRGADRVQLVIPAAQVLITRATLPKGARRRGSVLAFAVEEATAAEPDANQVMWLGTTENTDTLAVLDKKGLQHWREALEAIGVRAGEVQIETLLLPHAVGEWSLAWDGNEGFVRTGEFEGAAVDSGDPAAPPLSLRMMLDAAEASGARPGAIGIHVISPGAAPDLAAWQKVLGLELQLRGNWDWRSAPEQSGVAMAQERRRWQLPAGALASLRPAAWIAGAALALHGIALVTGWMLLGNEQRAVRAQMEARFRGAFPDAVAVADPVLQMRRQLAVARHRAGLPDGGDFAPMYEKVALGLKGLPSGSLRVVAYESGRMTLEFAAADEAVLRRTAARLAQSGLLVDVTGTKLLTVRPL